MKANTCLFVFFIFLLSCKKEKTNPVNSTTQQKEANIAPKKLITDPKETEVWEPVPKLVSFNDNNVPSDAIVLFDGTNLDQWISSKDNGKALWTIKEDNTMTVKPGTGDIQTREKFGSVQLHLEWSAPDIISGEGQGRGNSGIFFQDKYEVQILDI